MRDPWEIQPGETSRAYAAFACYRDLGPSRSLDTAFRKLCATTARVNGQWSHWSATNKWVQRALAWDLYLDEIRRQERECEIARLAERRFKYELDNQARLERRIERIEKLLDKADQAPVTDVTRKEIEELTDENGKPKGVVERSTKVKGINFSGYARLAKQADDAAKQAINGVRPKTVEGDRGLAELPDLVIDLKKPDAPEPDGTPEPGVPGSDEIQGPGSR